MEIVIVIVFIIFLAWRESRHEAHVKDLEAKLSSLNPNYPVSPKPQVRLDKNTIMTEDNTEVFLGDIAHLDIPKDFNIQTEGDSETPMEQRARGQR